MTDKGLISNIYKQLEQLNIKKSNNPVEKMARTTEETFLQRGNADGQQAHEKVLNITSWECQKTSQLSEWLPSKRTQTTHVSKAMEKREPRTLLVGMSLVQPLWNTVWKFLRKLKIELPYDPAILLLVYISPQNPVI